ncbi:MAG: hypothetical protein AAF585_28505, partial [Verrucomicrobiota bacterium]
MSNPKSNLLLDLQVNDAKHIINAAPGHDGFSMAINSVGSGCSADQHSIHFDGSSSATIDLTLHNPNNQNVFSSGALNFWIQPTAFNWAIFTLKASENNHM